MTQEHKAHPWLFEDAGLRLEDSAALSFRAAELFDKAIAAGGSRVDDIRAQRDHVRDTARSLRGKSLHFLETLAAHNARMVQYDPQQFALVIKYLDGLLERDVQNQAGSAAVAQKLAEFREDPKEWLKVNLSPRTYETICTPDWTKWTTFQE